MPFLDELPLLACSIPYGELGRGGHLGYEGKAVRIGGFPSVRALSAHGPSRLRVGLDGKYARFEAFAAINDDVPAGQAHADFLVYADGQLVACERGVAAGDVARRISCGVEGVQELELVVEAVHWEHCHSVWHAAQAVMYGEEECASTLEDPLGRVRMTLPTVTLRADRCIAAVVSPGYESFLETMLRTLDAAGNCPDALRVVFAVDAGAQCRETAARFGAMLVECTSLRPVTPTVKSVLYAVAAVVEAKHYLCLDADVLVLGDLCPLFTALDVCSAGSILACRDPYIGSLAGNLGRSFDTFYRGSPDDRALLFGPGSEALERYPLLVNDGVFAGGREALLALDRTLRALPDAARDWVDALAWHRARNQFLFNWALACLQRGVEMDPVFNYQEGLDTLEWREESGRAQAFLHGRVVRIKHFPGSMRPEYERLRDRLAAMG